MSVMNKVKLQVKAISLTPEDWGLFEDMDGVDVAARALNGDVALATEEHDNRAAAESMIHRMMGLIEKFGAFDTEPRAVLNEILDRVYGEEL